MYSQKSTFSFESKLVTHYNPYKLKIKSVANILLRLHDSG